MGEVTGIEWCDHTFTPWIGCARSAAAPAAAEAVAEAAAAVETAAWLAAAAAGVALRASADAERATQVADLVALFPPVLKGEA